MEIWKTIVGYEGLYEVSNQGRVKSLERYINNSFGGKSLNKEMLLKQHINNKGGYVQTVLCKCSKLKTYTIHRLVAIAFLPNPDNKPQVNHIDGIKTNNNVSNLEWNTSSENNYHSVRTGLKKPMKGEKNGLSKLTEIQVLEIRQKYSTGKYTQRKLAIKYNVSQYCIYSIIKRNTWTHI